MSRVIDFGFDMATAVIFSDRFTDYKCIIPSMKKKEGKDDDEDEWVTWGRLERGIPRARRQTFQFDIMLTICPGFPISVVVFFLMITTTRYNSCSLIVLQPFIDQSHYTPRRRRRPYNISVMSRLYLFVYIIYYTLPCKGIKTLDCSLVLFCNTDTVCPKFDVIPKVAQHTQHTQPYIYTQILIRTN